MRRIRRYDDSLISNVRVPSARAPQSPRARKSVGSLSKFNLLTNGMPLVSACLCANHPFTPDPIFSAAVPGSWIFRQWKRGVRPRPGDGDAGVWYINLEIRCLTTKLSLFNPLDTPTKPTHSFTLSNYTMKTFVILSVILAQAFFSNAGGSSFSPFPRFGGSFLSDQRF